MRLLARVVLMLAMGLAAATGARATPESALSTTGSDFERTLERQTFALINQYRAKDDLPALKWHEGIAGIARAHSRDMATGGVDFGHSGFGDRVDQMKLLVAGFEGAGENVLYTDNLNDLAERAVQMWLHSPHHLRNIRGDYNLSGIGVWESPSGAIYFTQLFLKIAEPGN